MESPQPDGRAGWTPVALEIGGRTLTGVFRTEADEVQVSADAGTLSRRLGSGERPHALATRLLAELHGFGPAAEAPPTDPAPRAAARPAGPPNNLVGVGLLALFVALGVALAFSPLTPSPLVFGFVLTGWVLAVMAHEFSHAAVAWLGGDHTVRAKGYLSFDPRRYGDLGTSLVIPLLALALGGIGFPGGAVYLRTDLMRNRFWRSASALAGPAATLLVLAALATVLAATPRSALPDALYAALAMLAFLQAMAAVLNLLPFPGLDGFNAIRPFLPRSVTAGLRRFEGLSMLALLAILFLVPGASESLFRAAAGLAAGLGVPRGAMAAGWDAFHFWR